MAIGYDLKDIQEAYANGRESAREGKERPTIPYAHEHPLLKAFEQGYYDESLAMLVDA